MGQFDLVQSPLTIKNLVIPNRIVFPPFVTGYSNPDGTINERQIEFYKQIAEGGAGMIVVGATAVAPPSMMNPQSPVRMQTPPGGRSAFSGRRV